MFTDNIDFRVAQVYGIYGLLGGGKTLTAVQIACEFLQLGHEVCTNILLNAPYSDFEEYHYIEDMTNLDWWSLPQGSPRGSDGTKRVAVIIDEAAEYFNQFSSTSPQVIQMLSWLRHSSKRGQFVFLVIQRPEFLVKSARSLCHSWIVCTDLAQWRIPGLRATIPFCSHLVLRRIFDNYGNLLSRGFLSCNKLYWGRFYNTAQIVNHADSSQLSNGSREFDFQMQFNIKFLFCFLVMLIYFYLLRC